MTTWVEMYHPALPGTPHIRSSSQAVAENAARGWLVVDGSTPVPTDVFLSPFAGDLRYLKVWTPNEVLTAGAVRVAPDGHVITRNANGTARATYDTTEQAAWTVVGGNSSAPLTVASTVTSAGALVTAKHTPVNATSGPLTMTLPTGAASGTLLAVEKTDATANAVTITGNMRGVAGQSIQLLTQYEVRLFVADSAGSWRPVADHRTKTSLDVTYAALLATPPRSNIAGPRYLVGYTRSDASLGNNGAPGFPGLGYVSNSFSKTQVTVAQACSDLRVLVGAPVTQELDLLNPVNVESSIEVSGTNYQFTFGGNTLGRITPQGGVLVSDPVALDIPAGTVVYLRTGYFTDFGTNTTLAGSVTVGGNALSVTAAPPTTMTFPFLLAVDSGTNMEAVTITSVTGTGPYTYNLKAGTSMAKAHASGVNVGQTVPQAEIGYTDRNEGFISGVANTDWVAAATWSPAAYSGTNRTLSAATNVGDTKLQTTVLITSPTLVVDTAGSQETVTVRTVQNIGANYIYYLTAPLASAHANGATIVAGNTFGALAPPLALVADRLNGTIKKSVLAIGDSIANQVGYALRQNISFVDLAFTSTRPYAKVPMNGETLQQWATLANSGKRRRVISLCDWMLIQLGTNDIGLNSSTLSQMQGWLGTIATLAKNRGVKVAVCTILPRTSSTDSWATIGNQSLGLSTGNEATRKNYNAWVRSGAGGNADLVVDLASVMDNGLVGGGAESGIIIADVNGPYIFDGLHPSSLGHQALGTYVAGLSW